MNVSPALASVLDRFPPEDMSHACANQDPEIFFLPEGMRGSRARAREDQAKKICRSCPVQADCLEYALALDVRYGIWGGQTAATIHDPQQHPRQETTMQAPDQFTELADLMRSTEGHPDQSVRAVRKIAAQALTALRILAAPAPPAIQAPAPPAEPHQPVERPAAKERAGKSVVTLLMEHHGIDAATVRAWATEQGIPVSSTGLLARRYVDMYIEAHP